MNRLIPATLFGLIALGLGGWRWAEAATEPGTGDTNSLPRNPRLARLLAEANASSAYRDVIRLAEAGVNPKVIKTFVEHSPRRFDPDPEQLVALHERGLPDDVLTAVVSKSLPQPPPVATFSPPATAAPLLWATSPAEANTFGSSLIVIPNAPRPVRDFPRFRPPVFWSGWSWDCGWPGTSWVSPVGWSPYRPSWTYDRRLWSGW